MSWGQVWGLPKCGFLCLRYLGSAETGVYPGLGYSGASSILWTCPVEQGSTRAYRLASDWLRQGPVAAVSVTVPLPSLTPFLPASHVGVGSTRFGGQWAAWGIVFWWERFWIPGGQAPPPAQPASLEPPRKPLPNHFLFWLILRLPGMRPRNRVQDKSSVARKVSPNPQVSSLLRGHCVWGLPPLRSTCPHPRAGFELLKPNGYEGRGRSERPQPHLLRFLVARALLCT